MYPKEMTSAHRELFGPPPHSGIILKVKIWRAITNIVQIKKK